MTIWHRVDETPPHIEWPTQCVYFALRTFEYTPREVIQAWPTFMLLIPVGTYIPREATFAGWVGRDDGPISHITHWAVREFPEPPKEEAWVAVEPEQAMPRVNGKPFRCECGCNVFTFLAKRAGGGGRYKCNACDAVWEGEPLGPPEGE